MTSNVEGGIKTRHDMTLYLERGVKHESIQFNS